MARIGWGISLVAILAAVALPAAADAQTAVGYAMDEQSGTTMSGFGGAPDGTISGDVTPGVPGVTGTAYAFNENAGNCDSSFHVTGTGAVTVPSSPVMAVGTQPFSFSAWVNTTTVPGADSGTTAKCDFDILRRGSSWRLELFPKGTLGNMFGAPHCAWKGVSNGKTVSVSLTAKTSDVTDGVWHQVTCARAQTGEQIIVDGTVVAGSAVDLGAINTNAQVIVGRNTSGNDFYEGQLDDIAFSIG